MAKPVNLPPLFDFPAVPADPTRECYFCAKPASTKTSSGHPCCQKCLPAGPKPESDDLWLTPILIRQLQENTKKDLEKRMEAMFANYTHP